MRFNESHAAELHGYHSAKFYRRSDLLQLPTSKFTYSAVTKARDRGCTILVTRGWPDWEEILQPPPAQISRLGNSSAKIAPDRLGKCSFEAILQKVCSDE